jgi:hypothetical protein
MSGPLTKSQAYRLRKLIREHVDAQLEQSRSGGGDPADWDIIDQEAEEAAARLKEYIRELQQ